MVVVAVGAPNLVVRTVVGFARLDVLTVEGGEVVTSTLAALGNPGTADIGGMAPLMASGALTGGGGDGPWLAPPNDACKGDRCLE